MATQKTESTIAMWGNQGEKAKKELAARKKAQARAKHLSYIDCPRLTSRMSTLSCEDRHKTKRNPCDSCKGWVGLGLVPLTQAEQDAYLNTVRAELSSQEIVDKRALTKNWKRLT